MYTKLLSVCSEEAAAIVLKAGGGQSRIDNSGGSRLECVLKNGSRETSHLHAREKRLPWASGPVGENRQGQVREGFQGHCLRSGVLGAEEGHANGLQHWIVGDNEAGIEGVREGNLPQLGVLPNIDRTKGEPDSLASRGVAAPQGAESQLLQIRVVDDGDVCREVEGVKFVQVESGDALQARNNKGGGKPGAASPEGPRSA